MNELTYYVALSRVAAMPTARKNALLAALFRRDSSLAVFFNTDERHWPSLGLFDGVELQLLSDAKSRLSNSAFVTEDLLEQGYALIPVTAPEYPRQVKRLMKYDSPVVLYCRGNLDLFSNPDVTVMGGEATGLPPDGSAIIVIPEGIMKYGTGFARLYPLLSTGRALVVSCAPPDSYRNERTLAEARSLVNALSAGNIGG